MSGAQARPHCSESSVHNFCVELCRKTSQTKPGKAKQHQNASSIHICWGIIYSTWWSWKIHWVGVTLDKMFWWQIPCLCITAEDVTTRGNITFKIIMIITWLQTVNGQCPKQKKIHGCLCLSLGQFLIRHSFQKKVLSAFLFECFILKIGKDWNFECHVDFEFHKMQYMFLPFSHRSKCEHMVQCTSLICK